MDNNTILLDHGSGGKIAHSLLSEIIIPLFNNDTLSRLDDGAVLDIAPAFQYKKQIKEVSEQHVNQKEFEVKGQFQNPAKEECENRVKIAFSTDSYVVDPIFFPGGNIGDLAINGTVNDIAMCGAEPKYISVALILEEGFPVDELTTIIKTMAEAAKKAGVVVVTGDTKVVPKGKADKIFINTSGFGVIPCGIYVSGSNAKPGDKVIISGTIADHGITILSSREGLKFDSDIKSDSAALNGMVKKILSISNLESKSLSESDNLSKTDTNSFLNSTCLSEQKNLQSNYGVHVLRDPTRGGVGTTLNEIASQSNVRINIWEDALPIKNSVRGMCELLGFDPLYLANEGKLIAIVSPESANRVLEIIKQDEYGKDAAIIGEVAAIDPPDKADQFSYEKASKETFGVFLKTSVGGFRIVDMLTGEQLPRIC
ncbi:MAG: hydrogenase expression/formation protein HypE [Desulfamplus sp.]|nr:hydrogenase expression/formation protein HypE [Desulfamplus sp.]